jgi:integrase/recombinase XerD
MKGLIDQFMDYLGLEKGLSPRSIEAYAHDLEHATDWLASHGVSDAQSVTRRHLNEYLLSLRDADLAPATIARRLVALRVFFRFLQQENLLAANVTDAMDSPRLWDVLPGTLSPEQVERLLHAPDPATPRGLRDRAMLELLYSTGLRVSELVGLRLDEIHRDARYLRVVGKGNKERVIPYGLSAETHLLRYLDQVRPAWNRAPGQRAVFLTRRDAPMSRKTFWALIRHYARLAGVEQKVSPHTLRHSFASHLLANHAPLRVIQEMLGHADIGTTQIYTHVDATRLRDVHRTFHPRA